jgi:hypothetical protein
MLVTVDAFDGVGTSRKVMHVITNTVHDALQNKRKSIAVFECLMKKAKAGSSPSQSAKVISTIPRFHIVS